MARLLSLNEAMSLRRAWKAEGRRVVFTNGCFDLLHAGHVRYLEAARILGDRLLIGLNSDGSIRRIKGPRRPVTPQAERAEILLALASVDGVVLFEEDTPLRIIEALIPDILVKGSDWSPDRIVGREQVESNGGCVATIPLLEGRSTSGLIRAAGLRSPDPGDDPRRP